MTNAPAHSQLLVPCIRCQSRIGCSDHERVDPRGVRVFIALAFSTPPEATTSDALADTVDYAALAARVTTLCGARPYRLLEHLARTLYDELRRDLPAQVQLWLDVAKEHSPLAEMEVSPRFGLGDWPGGAALATLRA